MRVLITGDEGRLGSRVRAQLEDAGHNVVGFDRIHGYDIRQPKLLDEAIAGCDVVVHLAAIPHPQKGTIGDYFRINVEGTFNVLQAAVKAKVKRVVYSSSTGYYGTDTNIHGTWRPLYLPIDEKHPPLVGHQQFEGWLSAYNQSKVMAEQLLAWYGVNGEVQTVVLRIAPANSKAEQYRKFDPYHPKPNDWRLNVMLANCHPDYAAAALVKAADLRIELPGWSVFNVADKYLPASVTPKLALELVGLETENVIFYTDKAERLLGWQPCEER